MAADEHAAVERYIRLYSLPLQGPISGSVEWITRDDALAALGALAAALTETRELLSGVENDLDLTRATLTETQKELGEVEEANARNVAWQMAESKARAEAEQCAERLQAQLAGLQEAVNRVSASTDDEWAREQLHAATEETQPE